MIRWRKDIENAPRDGTEIDVWCVELEYGTAETFNGRRLADVAWRVPYIPGGDNKDTDYCWCTWDRGWIERIEYPGYRVTHWSPINPPEEE